MAGKPKPELVPAGHGIDKLANIMADAAYDHAAMLRISKWDVCVALANACGMILADSKDMPRDKALERMDALRVCAQGAYEDKPVRARVLHRSRKELPAEESDSA